VGVCCRRTLRRVGCYVGCHLQIRRRAGVLDNDATSHAHEHEGVARKRRVSRGKCGSWVHPTAPAVKGQAEFGRFCQSACLGLTITAFVCLWHKLGVHRRVQDPEPGRRRFAVGFVGLTPGSAPSGFTNTDRWSATSAHSLPPRRMTSSSQPPRRSVTAECQRWGRARRLQSARRSRYRKRRRTGSA
jgi:hypothetical protein